MRFAATRLLRRRGNPPPDLKRYAISAFRSWELCDLDAFRVDDRRDRLSQDHAGWPIIVRLVAAAPVRRTDLRRSILVSTATAPAAMDPHGLAALAWARVGHAGGAPGRGGERTALWAAGLRLGSGQRCQHCDRAKQFESSHVILHEPTRHAGHQMAGLALGARYSGAHGLLSESG